MKTILIDHDANFLTELENRITDCYPIVDVIGKFEDPDEAYFAIAEETPDVVFLDFDLKGRIRVRLKPVKPADYEVVFTALNYEHVSLATLMGASGYLVKPVKEHELNAVINYCIQERNSGVENMHHSSAEMNNNLISIPTIEGAEFLMAGDIIRCEGLQKCTRIVTTERSDIISSYHVGIFRSLLADFNFIQTHKSHLINLLHIKKYLREGTIYMSDGSAVPVSRRRKGSIFQGIRQPHLIRQD